MIDANSPSVADIHKGRIRELTKIDHRFEPILQIPSKGIRELAIRQHAMLFSEARVSNSILDLAIVQRDMMFGHNAPGA